MSIINIAANHLLKIISVLVNSKKNYFLKLSIGSVTNRKKTASCFPLLPVFNLQASYTESTEMRSISARKRKKAYFKNVPFTNPKHHYYLTSAG